MSKRDPSKAWSLAKIATLHLSITDVTTLIVLIISSVLFLTLASMLISATAGDQPAYIIETLGFVGSAPLAIIALIEFSNAKKQSASMSGATAIVADVVVHCPQGHECEKLRISKEQWKKGLYCDVCLITQARGKVMDCCLVCSWHLCSSCSDGGKGVVKINRISTEGLTSSLPGAAAATKASATKEKASTTNVRTSIVKERGSSVKEYYVSELSWLYVGLGFVLSVIKLGSSIMFAVTEDDSFSSTTNLLWGVSYAVAFATIFAKPLRKDRSYLIFMHAHFFIQCLVDEVLNLNSHAWAFSSTIVLLVGKVFVLCVSYWFCLHLRAWNVAMLKPDVLHDFLVNTMMKKTFMCMVPILLLSLEGLPCIVSGEQGCDDGMYTSLFLEGFLLMVLVFSVVKRVGNGGNEITVEKMVNLDMNPRTKTQTLLSVIVGIISLSLLPYIGRGIPKQQFISYVLGICGCVCAAAVLFIEVWVAYWEDRREKEEEKQAREAKESDDTKRRQILMRGLSSLNPFKSSSKSFGGQGELGKDDGDNDYL
jgi:hypothetical protein